ncbi:hypothetical protein [Ochrobactrum chromiisoli]|uniref:Uncharacterized protein n=1 Tax=Ochrobactrum chromiisoli TaxID=2993941 RepID=A0ABT3QQI4_9HYPH|nr:hypothetical protein [Ochrobactrum chromiisoli]MCX2697870.1 hypothetical protein [Ochrobactrum chromiisoli]
MTLIDRLSKLDGPDREVDAEICILFQYGGKNSEGALNVRTDPEWGDDDDLLYELDGDPCCAQIPKLTASVDAALALAERVFPGCDIETSDVHADFRGSKEPRHIADLSSDLVWEKYDGYPEPVYRIRGAGQSNIRAIALLIALLRAKEASHGE